MSRLCLFDRFWGTELAVKNQGHTRTPPIKQHGCWHSSRLNMTTRWIVGSCFWEGKRLNTQKSTLMGSTHSHCSRESCAWLREARVRSVKQMTRRPIKGNSWGPFCCRSATQLDFSITLAASVFHPQDCELLRGHRTGFGCRPCEWIISTRTSEKASLKSTLTTYINITV